MLLAIFDATAASSVLTFAILKVREILYLYHIKPSKGHKAELPYTHYKKRSPSPLINHKNTTYFIFLISTYKA
jgi:hypothetical protein